MKDIGIYKFTNLINNKSYIGQTIHLKTRYGEHKRNHLNINHVNYECLFYRALRKYGFENFTFEILEYCSEKELNKKEKYWVKHYDSYLNGYNMTPGGDFNPSKVKEIVERRTQKLLNDPEINKKLASRGHSIITEDDVKKIRELYKEGKTFKEVYPMYENKLSYSGFQQCWRGKTWSHIMPEVFQIRPVENTGGSSLNSQLIYGLRKDYMNGFSKDDLIKKYNITKPNLNRILKLDRWNKENAIPSGYKEFISN